MKYLKTAFCLLLLLLCSETVLAARPNPVTVPYEKEWRTWDFPYFHISIGKVLMWEHTKLADPEEQKNTQEVTAKIKERGIAPLFQMAWDPIHSNDPGQKEWCEWKQARPQYWLRDRNNKLSGEDYYTDTISAVMPYDAKDWPDGVKNGTRVDWDLEKLVSFAMATGATGYFAADKYDLGWAHFQHTTDCDFNPRIIEAFGKKLGITIPGNSVPEQSDFIRKHHFVAWTDYICQGIAKRHTSLQPRLKALGVEHPMVAFQVDYPIAYHRIKGLDYRMLAERAQWGGILKRVELQGDGLRDLLPKGAACNDFGLFACLAPDMMFGAQMNADHVEFWRSLDRVWKGEDHKKEYGHKYLRQQWLAVGWWHIANTDGTVRRGVCEMMRHYWDGGIAPEQAAKLMRAHVPTHPFGLAFYYSRPIELLYEKDYPATGELYPLGNKAYVAQQRGMPVGYSVSDIALDGLLAHKENYPAGWLTIGVDQMATEELKKLRRIAPVYDIDNTNLETIPSPIHFSQGASGYAFRDQNDETVILVWRQGRPAVSKNEANFGSTKITCTVSFDDVPDGTFWVRDLFDEDNTDSIIISQGNGSYSFDLDRWDCRAFISNIKAK